MSQQMTPTIAIEAIQIDEGFNARKAMDQVKLEKMAASIERHELVHRTVLKRS